jgi:hypothetical protein
MSAIKDARESPWEEALVVSVVAVWIEKDEPLAQSKKPPKMVEATNVRVDRYTTVGNS